MAFDPITIDNTTGGDIAIPANTGRNQVLLRIIGDRVWINFNAPAEVGKCEFMDEGDVGRFWGERATADIYLVTESGKSATGYYVDGHTNMEIVPGNPRDGDQIPVKVFPNENLLQQPLPHINLINGDNLGIDAEFGGTPVLLYDEDAGTPTEWAAAAVVGGARWTFNSTAQPKNGTINIDATGVQNGDIMQLVGVSVVDFGDYVAITGWIWLTQVLVIDDGQGFDLYAWDTVGGTIIGNAVDIANYIDETQTMQYLKFSIPLTDMGIEASSVGELRIEAKSDTPGVPSGPKAYFDWFKLEETGGALLYTTLFAQPANTIYYASKLKIYYRGSLDIGTNPFPEIDVTKYFHLDALASGITNIITSGGTIIAAVTFTDIEANLKLGESTIRAVSRRQVSSGPDVFESVIEIIIEFPDPIALDSTKGDQSQLELSDNLEDITFHSVYMAGRYIRI